MRTFTESKLTPDLDGKALAMAKPKLLVMASTFPAHATDGTPSFVYDLAKEQAKEFDVTVLAPFVEGAKNSDFPEINLIRFRYWPFAHRLAQGAILDNLKQQPWRLIEVPFLLLGMAIALSKVLRKENPATIHAHWILPQGIIAALKKGDRNLVVTTHGGDIYALNNRLLVALKKWVMKKATAVTCVNRVMAKQVASWGVPSNKVNVLPMGVDLSLADSSKKRTKNQLVVVGRLVEKKGIGYLIEALRLGSERKQLPEGLKLVIAGDGPLRSELERQAHGLPVSFLGAKSKAEIFELFATSELALLPSVKAASGDQEGLPVTLLEAAASGCFVIASDLDGINDLVIDQQTGLLVAPADSESLLDAILRALGDDALRAHCSTAMSLAIKEYEQSVIGARYNQLIGAL